jgi:hypothetical protein
LYDQKIAGLPNGRPVFYTSSLSFFIKGKEKGKTKKEKQK